MKYIVTSIFVAALVLTSMTSTSFANGAPSGSEGQVGEAPTPQPAPKVTPKPGSGEIARFH